jgi:hypothetical protein
MLFRQQEICEGRSELVVKLSYEFQQQALVVCQLCKGQRSVPGADRRIDSGILTQFEGRYESLGNALAHFPRRGSRRPVAEFFRLGGVQ